MASLMKLSVPHTLSQEEAVRRVKGLLPGLKQRFAKEIKDLKEQWTGDRCEFSFKARGFSISGTLTIKASEVVLEGKLPILAATLFGSTIENRIVVEARSILA